MSDTSITTVIGAQQGREPIEPKQTYINDILVQIEAEFPGTADDDMPSNALDSMAEPEGTPVTRKP